MKWLFVLVIVAIIGYIVWVNQSAPQSPEEQRKVAISGPSSVAKYYCIAAMNGDTGGMDSVCTEKGRGDATHVVELLRAEERSLQTEATQVIAAIGGGAGSNVRDAKCIFRDADDRIVFMISVIRTEKQDNGEWRVTHVSVN